MAAIRLNLLIEQDVVEKMKEYVAQHHTSISKVVENILLAIMTSRYKSDKMKISPLVKSLSIDNVKLPDDFDYKEELTKALEEKYL
jgi:hypothetical protein